MPSAVTTPQDIDTTFTAPIIRDQTIGGWTVVLMPGSGAFFGTRKPVEVAGTIDGHPFAATMLPKGDGTHLVPSRPRCAKPSARSTAPTSPSASSAASADSHRLTVRPRR